MIAILNYGTPKVTAWRMHELWFRDIVVDPADSRKSTREIEKWKSLESADSKIQH